MARVCQSLLAFTRLEVSDMRAQLAQHSVRMPTVDTGTSVLSTLKRLQHLKLTGCTRFIRTGITLRTSCQR